jgi:hypothetical protein
MTGTPASIMTDPPKIELNCIVALGKLPDPELWLYYYDVDFEFTQGGQFLCLSYHAVPARSPDSVGRMDAIHDKERTPTVATSSMSMTSSSTISRARVP